LAFTSKTKSPLGATTGGTPLNSPIFLKTFILKNVEYVPTWDLGQKEAGREQPKGIDGRVRDCPRFWQDTAPPPHHFAYGMLAKMINPSRKLAYATGKGRNNTNKTKRTALNLQVSKVNCLVTKATWLKS
jgi:hypothetical protein